MQFCCLAGGSLSADVTLMLAVGSTGPISPVLNALYLEFLSSDDEVPNTKVSPFLTLYTLVLTKSASEVFFAKISLLVDPSPL